MKKSRRTYNGVHLNKKSNTQDVVEQSLTMQGYQEIDTIPVKVAQMQRAGYLPVASFVLPEKCWTEHYYQPLSEARKLMLKKYPHNETVKKLIEFQHLEEALYNKYKGFYGYVFYIGKKI